MDRTIYSDEIKVARNLAHRVAGATILIPR